MTQAWDELIARQHGICTVDQALAHGLTRAELRLRQRDRVYRRVAPETLYVGGASDLTLHARMWRAVLSLDGAVLSHTTAAQLWELRLPWSDDVHVTVPRELWRPRTHMQVHTAKTIDRADVSVRQELPVSALERSLVDAFAVLPTAGQRRTLVAESLRVAATTADRLSECVLRMDKVRRRAELFRVIELAAGGSQSAGEMRLYEFLCRRSFPETQRQYVVDLPTGRRMLDCALSAYKIAIEYDGRHHLTDDQQYDDQLRDEALRRAHWITMRVSDRRLRDERRLAQDIWANMRDQAERFSLPPPSPPHPV